MNNEKAFRDLGSGFVVMQYEKRRTYECVYNFINTYNRYWSSPNSGYSISII